MWWSDYLDEVKGEVSNSNGVNSNGLSRLVLHQASVFQTPTE